MKKNVLIILLSILLFTNCHSSINIRSSSKNQVSLKDSNRCNGKIKNHKIWSYLYGAYTFKKIGQDDFIHNDKRYKSYRFTIKHTIADTLITILLGSTLSITRYSIAVERCKN